METNSFAMETNVFLNANGLLYHYFALQMVKWPNVKRTDDYIIRVEMTSDSNCTINAFELSEMRFIG